MAIWFDTLISELPKRQKCPFFIRNNFIFVFDLLPISVRSSAWNTKTEVEEIRPRFFPFSISVFFAFNWINLPVRGRTRYNIFILMAVDCASSKEYDRTRRFITSQRFIQWPGYAQAQDEGHRIAPGAVHFDVEFYLREKSIENPSERWLFRGSIWFYSNLPTQRTVEREQEAAQRRKQRRQSPRTFYSLQSRYSIPLLTLTHAWNAQVSRNHWPFSASLHSFSFNYCLAILL